MMLVPLAWIAPAQNADQLLDRLTDKLKVGFAVDFTLKHTSFPGEIKGHYEYMPGINCYFRAIGAGSDFVFIERKEGAIEIENNLKGYYETGPLGAIYTTGSRMSQLSTHAFPYLIARAAPRTAFPEQDKWRFVKQESVNGVMGNRIAAGTAQAGVDIWITDEGRLLRYVHNFTMDYAPAQTDFKFGPFGKPNPKLFNLSPPRGYRALALPRNSQPLLPGNKLPAEGWLDRQNRSVSLPIQGNTLFVLTTADCAVTSRAKGMLAEIAAKSPVIVLSDKGSPSGLEKYPLFRDVQKATLDRFMAQATPHFVTVDSKGIITGNWMGFNPKEQAALKAEILKRLEK